MNVSHQSSFRPAHRVRIAGVCAFLLAGLLVAPSPAAAQLSRAGATKPLIPGALLWGDVAHDPRNDVYLSVIAWGTVWAAFADATGTPITSFTIPTPAGAVPRVAYGPDLNGGKGAFLVSFHQYNGHGDFVHSAVVAYPAGLVSIDGVAPHLAALQGTAVSAGMPSLPQGGGPSIAYSPEAKKFLVTWTATDWSIKGRLVDGVTGVPEGGVISVGPAGTFHSDAAWNPQTKEFGVAYAAHAGHISFARVNTAGVNVAASTSFGWSGGTYNTALAVTAAGRYVVGWVASGGARSLELDSSGNPLAGFPTLISSQVGTVSSFAFALNPVSGTILAVSEGATSREVPGVELSSAGVPLGIAVPLTDGAGPVGADGSYAPRVAARQTGKQWSISYARLNGAYTLANQIVATSSTDTASGPPTQAPVVKTHPVTTAARLGHTVTFTASATGAPAPSVQWQAKAPGAADFSDIPDATSTSLAVFAAPAHAGKRFRARFTNSAGSADSTEAVLIVKPTLNDINGDGRTDPLLWRPSTGAWRGATSSGTNSLSSSDGIQFGGLGDKSLTGDMDGDGVADIVVFRQSTGRWFWLKSSTGYDGGQFGTLTWGGPGDVGLLADVDGDGKADPIVWRPSTGFWYWLHSSTGFTTAGSLQWGSGSVNDQPLTGDFDGDGRADIAVWRPATGQWFWLTSASNFTAGFTVRWGGFGDVPLLADFDGDGRVDITVFRPSTGQWFWVTSISNFTAGFTVTWGGSGDHPMLADFDSDGRADITVFRPSTGQWFGLTSSTGWTSGPEMTFGGFGDIIVR